MDMHNPAHPGELLAGWLADLEVTVTAFAGHVGISRPMLSRVLNGRSAVSADIDLRLSEALGTTPGFWLAMQTQRDLWTARESGSASDLPWFFGPLISGKMAAPFSILGTIQSRGGTETVTRAGAPLHLLPRSSRAAPPRNSCCPGGRP